MTTPITIRPAHPADLETVLAIETAGFPTSDRWSPQAWADELAAHRVILLADTVGVITWQVVAEVADLLRVVVVPHARGQGVGRQLVQAGLQAVTAQGATRVLLEVEADNTAARALYTSCGFRAISQRSSYYGTGRDAVIMELVLNLKGNGDE